MAEKIYLADKKTLDNVKQDTQYIRSQFPISEGTDWSKYENVEKYNDKEISSSSCINSIAFEIKGKGYIRDLIIAADCLIDADIYIDDKKYLNINHDSKGSKAHKTAYGIARIGDILKLGYYYIGKTFVENESINRFLAHPIFFTNNVRVELKKGYIESLYFLGGIEK